MKNLFSTGKTYELPLSPDYVRHWGMAEAVRELIQNAIDSDSPFEYSIDGGTLRIISRHARLEVSTLLLGTTSKAESTDKIGSFGEGYKIALLVLARCGYDVSVFNAGKLWRPFFQMSKNFGANVFCIEETEAPRKVEGVVFEVQGLSPADVEAVRDSCLQMQSDIGEFHEVSQGRILRSRPGRLYVGGLFVCKTSLQFGYDVKPSEIRLERDRQTVNNFDLLFLVKTMWFETERFEEIARMVGDKVPDMEYAEYGAPEVVRDACYRAFKAENPGAVIAKDQAELDRLISRGMTKIVVSPQYYPHVISHPEYLAKVATPMRPPADVLRDWLSANRREMRGAAIEKFKKELLQQASHWRLK